LLGGIGGGAAIQGSAGPCPPAELASRIKAFFEGLKPLADLAGRHNSRLAIENHGQALLDSPDSFKAFVELNPFKRVGVALAPYHLQARGDPVEEAIRVAGPPLLCFYAWPKAEGLAQLPGHGSTDFRPGCAPWGDWLLPGGESFHAWTRQTRPNDHRARPCPRPSESSGLSRRWSCKFSAQHLWQSKAFPVELSSSVPAPPSSARARWVCRS
jgi:hypothetical protein